MCDYIHLGVPASHEAWLRETHAREWHLARNVHADIARAMPAGIASFVINANSCCCGLYFGSAGRDADNFAERLAKKRRGYERRGWSESKIARAMGSREPPPIKDYGLDPTVIALVQDVCRHAGRVVVLVHEYTGAIDRGRVNATPASCSLADFPERACALRRDELLVVTDRESEIAKKSSRPRATSRRRGT